jgi:C1A family cysteine protease
MQVLSRHWEELKKKPHYLNSAVGMKFIGGNNTGVPAIVIYVSKKVPLAELAAEHLIPAEIEGVPTDVVELAPSTWQAGETAISKLHPAEQLRRLGANPRPKVILLTKPTLAQTGLEYSWKQYCTPIRDQGNCGSCVGEGCVGDIETEFAIATKVLPNSLQLSVAEAFFCAGGTCDGGSDPDTVLDWILANGLVTESVVPYSDVDQPCNKGPANATVYQIQIFKELANINDIRQALTTGPLVTVMAVHQSFFNLVSGVYHSLGDSDPIVGYHCVVNIGIHDSISAYDGRNSWGVDFAEAGYFQIAFGESGFDDQGWKVLVVSPQPPTPKPQKCWLCRLFKKGKARA